MVQEPYYASGSSSSFIKPSNSSCYSYISQDIPNIPSVSWVAPPALNTGFRSRKNSLEPYYSKTKKTGTLPPKITSLYRYKFGEENDQESFYQDDDCALLSDDDDTDLLIGNRQIISAPTSATLSRKVSDNYRYSNQSDEEIDKFGWDSRQLNPVSLLSKTLVSKNPSSPSKPVESVPTPPHIHDLLEINNMLLLKSNNPNILINPISRSLSDSLIPPTIDDHNRRFTNDIYDLGENKARARDDFDYEKKCEFFI